MEKSGYKNGIVGFYDLVVIVVYKFNDKYSFNVYGYYSYDCFVFNLNEKYGYNNFNVFVWWRVVFNEKLIGYFFVGYDYYDYNNCEIVNVLVVYKFLFDIN